MKQADFDKLKLFLELWEIHAARGALEVEMARLQRLYGATLAANRKNKGALKFEILPGSDNGNGRLTEINQDVE